MSEKKEKVFSKLKYYFKSLEDDLGQINLLEDLKNKANKLNENEMTAYFSSEQDKAIYSSESQSKQEKSKMSLFALLDQSKLLKKKMGKLKL